MNTRRMSARRVAEEVVIKGVPPRGEKVREGVQDPQVYQVSIANQWNEVPVAPSDMTNEEVRGALFTIA